MGFNFFKISFYLHQICTQASCLIFRKDCDAGYTELRK